MNEYGLNPGAKPGSYCVPIPNLGKPYVGSLGSGLFEIRTKGKEGIGRSLYCMAKGKEIVILHSFIKKTQKTPKKDFDLAKKRMKEVQNE